MPNPGIATVVHCRMVDEDIDVALCDIEQNPRDCRGCTAATRRCTQCKKARGIADPEAGLCPRCADPRTANAKDDGRSGPADLDDVIDRLRDITEVSETEPATKASRAGMDNADPLPSPLLKNPSALFPALMEHGEKHGERWSVRLPATILMGRFHLLRPEAIAALRALRKQGHLEGTDPWDEVILRTTEGIQELKARVADSRGGVGDVRDRIAKNLGSGKAAAQASVSSQWKRPQSGASPSSSAPVPHPAHAAPTPTPPSIAKPRDADAEMRAILEGKAAKLLEDAHAHLWQQSRAIGTVRQVGGAIPLLQLRFKGGARQAVEILEALERKKLIEPLDGWRSLRIFPAATTPPGQAPQAPQAPAPTAVAKAAPPPAPALVVAPTAPSTTPARTGSEESEPVSEREAAIRILRTHVRDGQVEDPIGILSQAMKIPESRASDLVARLCRDGRLRLIRNDDEIYRWTETAEGTSAARPQRTPAAEDRGVSSRSLSDAIRRIEGELERLVQGKEALERRIVFLESAMSAAQGLARNPTKTQAAVLEAILTIASTIDQE